MIDSTCESIKEKILLCEELTDAEKEHIAQCEECRAVSLQTEKMLLSLSQMSVPGIKDGEIAESVMKEVRKTKTASFPRFKMSNHVGTAAALVIVVAMFAFVKLSDSPVLDAKNANDNASPVRNVTLTESYDEGAGGDKQDGIQFSDIAENGASEESSQKLLTVKDLKKEKSESSDSVTYSASTGNAPMLYASREATDEEQQFEDSVAVEADSHEDYTDTDISAQTDDAMHNMSVSSNSFDPYAADVSDAGAQTERASGGAGGSSSAAAYKSADDMMSEEEIFEESIAVETAEEIPVVSLFKNVEFLSENTLEENVSLANSCIKAMFEDANLLKTETLKQAQITNEQFVLWLETVVSVGEYSFDSLYSYVQSKN